MTSEGIMLSLRVLPEIYYCLEKEIGQINSTGEIQWQDRKVNKEAIINAVLADYLGKAKSERRPILRSAIKTVEIMLESRDAKEKDEARLLVGNSVSKEEIEKFVRAESEEQEELSLKPAKRK